MRHGDKVNNLGRKKGHRTALLKNLANALIQHKRINTTLAKAKALKVFIEPLITKSKENTTHNRRVAFSYLQEKESIKELFDVISIKVANRPGGYVRVVKTGFRQGDSAETAMIELVDYNELMLAEKLEGGKKRVRKTRRGGGAKKSEEAVSSLEVPSTVPETPNSLAAPEENLTTEQI